MSGHPHTLLTSAFSHIDVQHLFNNMVASTSSAQAAVQDGVDQQWWPRWRETMMTNDIVVSR
uniref:Uncharacterized protein n=1 Tax=Triticum urartu TaxID=4572 RepID=A0A8R7QJT1_TRIUA